MKEVNDQQIAVMTRALQKFGYPTVTDEVVREAVGKIERGEKLNIIGRFVEGFLKEAGLL